MPRPEQPHYLLPYRLPASLGDPQQYQEAARALTDGGNPHLSPVNGENHPREPEFQALLDFAVSWVRRELKIQITDVPTLKNFFFFSAQDWKSFGRSDKALANPLRREAYFSPSPNKAEEIDRITHELVHLLAQATIGVENQESGESILDLHHSGLRNFQNDVFHMLSEAITELFKEEILQEYQSGRSGTKISRQQKDFTILVGFLATRLAQEQAVEPAQMRRQFYSS